MDHFYYPSGAVNHLQELSIIASLRASMKPGDALRVLPSGRLPYFIPAARDEALIFDIPSHFFDGSYYYFYGNKFTSKDMERLSFASFKNKGYDPVVFSNSLPTYSDARSYFFSLSHTSLSKAIYKMIMVYNKPNNAFLGLDIPLFPNDLVTVIWGKESLKQMEDVLFLVQNTNAYFLLLNPSTERLLGDFLLVHKKRYSSFKNQTKFISDYHALFSAKVLISLNPKILTALGFSVHRGNGYYYSISSDTRYML